MNEDYDAEKDVAGCFEEAYCAIRERVRNGGPGWEPKVLQCWTKAPSSGRERFR